MDFVELKKNGYRIVTNWQDCNKKTIFIFHSNNSSKFLSYKNLALKKKCKFIVCNFKFKNKNKQSSINFFYYKNKKDLEKIAKIFYNFDNCLPYNF